MQTKGQQAYDFIIEKLNSGKTIYIANSFTCKKITPANFAKWAKSGHQLFKVIDGELFIASGKKFNCMVTKYVSLVTIKAA